MNELIDPHMDVEHLGTVNESDFFLRTQLRIFKLYTLGWKINELAKKFGATPATIKFTVWNVQHFFEEELPKNSIEDICERLLDMD